MQYIKKTDYGGVNYKYKKEVKQKHSSKYQVTEHCKKIWWQKKTKVVNKIFTNITGWLYYVWW